MSKPLHVLLFGTTDSQGTDWWRGAGVFAKDPRYKVTPVDLSPRQGWSFLEHIFAQNDYDFAYIIRPLVFQHQYVIDELHALRIPVVVDWDDTVFELPANHPGQHQYTTNATQFVRRIYDTVDAASFSTKGVQDHFKKHCRMPEKQAVFQNCLHDLFWVADKYRGTTNKDMPLLVRGSHCHLPDWNYARAKWFDPNPQDYTFLGINPFSLREIQAMPCLIFNKWLPISPSRAFFFPLVPNEFNRGKSNICAIEANVAGQVCIVPDLKEFPEFADSGWALDAQTLADLKDPGSWEEHWRQTRAKILAHAEEQRDYRANTLASWFSSKDVRVHV